MSPRRPLPSDVVLVQPPAWGASCPPYGIAVLKAYLASRGHPAWTLDLNIRLYKAAGEALRAMWKPERHQFWLDPEPVARAFRGELRREVERAVRDILARRPRVVGFSCVFSNEQAGLLLAARLKAERPDLVVVFGGPQASRDAGARRLLESGVVDYAVEGEGELTFADFLDRLKAGEDPSGAPGLTLRRAGRVEAGPARPLAPDVSAIPPADYSDFPMLEYADVGCIPVSLSRGCPNKCEFCYEVQYWRRFRVRKAKALLQELKFLHLTLPRISWLWFHDSLINGHMGELRAFARGLVEENLVVPWASQAVIRPEMTKETLRLLRESGCMSLNYGLESASFATMLKMGKVLAKGSDLDRIVRDTREAGIDCNLNFMFGYPGETEEDYQLTLDFVRRNKDWISLVQPSPGFCDFYPGTSGHKDPERLGIRLREGSAHWESLDGTNTYPSRMERFERFLRLAHDLGVPCSYPGRELYMRSTILGNYHFDYGRYREALPHLERAAESDPPSEALAARLADCRARVAALPPLDGTRAMG